ncbi:MAG: hypothetical protein AAFO63_12355 [Pseudomonadota bacterium]
MAQSKQKKHPNVDARGVEGRKIAETSGSESPQISPARQLQLRLHAQFRPEIAPVWTRYVTLFVALSFAGAWMF